MGELTQMFVHTLHAEPLRVEKTTVLAGENKNLAYITFHTKFYLHLNTVFRVHAIVFLLKDVILPNVLFVLVVSCLVACSVTVHLINRLEMMNY